MATVRLAIAYYSTHGTNQDAVSQPEHGAPAHECAGEVHSGAVPPGALRGVGSPPVGALRAE